MRKGAIMTILQTEDLKKYYGQEPNITKALDGVNLSVEQGGISGGGRHQRQRKVHAAAYDGRAGYAYLRQRESTGKGAGGNE